ncbi:MAG TPA: type I methionyl aminopeptidase [Candidatus Paceibacterota bacterium]|jgi:methionyl aminopeptidase|nr:type I methionyl aminopeptidase [Candidatus Paceibacterota bacterium]
MIAKTQEEINGLRKAGKVLAEALRHTATLVVPGVSTAALDLAAEDFIKSAGATSAFLNYKQEGSAYPFPAVLCVSINEEVVHGIPSEDRIVEEGDLVMLDLGLSIDGYFADAAITVVAGKGDEKGKKLIEATEEALREALKVAKPGARMGDLGAAIQTVAKKYGLGVVEELGGHSLGRVPHEGPFVPNVGKAGQGPVLEEGLVLAIEPIFTEGAGDIELMPDEWTYVTADHSRSAETEHTVLITKDGAEVLTA